MQITDEEKQEYETYHCPNPNCNSVFCRPKIIKYYVCPTCQTLIKRGVAQGNAKPKKQGPTEEDFKRKEAERLEAEKKANQLEVALAKAEQKIARLEAELEGFERKGAKQLDAQRKLEQLAERLAERLKVERLESEKQVKQLETEKLEAQRKVEQIEAERKAKQLEVERLETQRRELEQKVKRLEAGLLETERIEAQRLALKRKVEQLETEQKEAKLLDAQRREAERLEAERKTAERIEAEKQQQVKSQALKLIAPAQTKQPVASAAAVNEQTNTGCKHYFGYLGQREKGEEIPVTCIECPKSLDCLLKSYKSKESGTEIKKWYTV